ncbi:MAG: class I SAM-dependent rRNA methyltransferase [Bacteroidota bacterium]|nr:class I SAM-dependent rRNA methyltransferase [Bacteroidota bacterium]
MKKIIKLAKSEERRILSGHLWVFSNEIKEIQGEPEIGDVVELRNHSGEFLGKGSYNPKSLIAFRLLTTEDEEIDFQFFMNRIESAYRLRKTLFPNSNTFRLIHGEGDFLPGLIIDKYNNYFSIQTFSYGMDRRLTLICDVLESLFSPKGIIQRDESVLRELEGLTEKKGVLRGEAGKTIITENNLKYTVDLLEGQKTGLFLDQRENRLAIQRYVINRKVLDCFCNDGGFALNAADAGAAEVVGVDISESAVSRSIQNAELNNLSDKCTFIKDDVFKFISKSIEEGQKYGVIILDPPSFTKSRKNITAAKLGYKEINTNAIRLLINGGILATASCSYHIDDQTFLELVNKSAKAAGRKIRLLEWRGASPDHPVLPAMPETKYLKFEIFEVS